MRLRETTETDGDETVAIQAAAHPSPRDGRPRRASRWDLSSIALLAVLVGCSSTVRSEHSSDGGPQPSGSGGRPSDSGGSSAGDGASATGGSAGDGGSIGRGCGEPQCITDAHIEFVLVGSYAEIRSSHGEICRNDQCVEVDLSALPALELQPEAEVSLTSVASDPWIRVRSESGTFILTAQWKARPATRKDGDVLSVRVTDASGRTVELSQAGDYAQGSPVLDCRPLCLEWRPPSRDLRCCPIDTEPASEMYLGGAVTDGCHESLDFPCAFNFRVGTDGAGCPVWHYDVEPCDPSDGGRE